MKMKSNNIKHKRNMKNINISKIKVTRCTIESCHISLVYFLFHAKNNISFIIIITMNYVSRFHCEKVLRKTIVGQVPIGSAGCLNISIEIESLCSRIGYKASHIPKSPANDVLIVQNNQQPTRSV